MLHKASSYIALVLLWIGFGANMSFSYAQSSEREKPRLEDFGSSLKRLKWDAKQQATVEAKRTEGKTRDEDVLRVETTLVVSDVLVLDAKGRSIEGLNQDDFIVTEDGKPQEISSFSLGDDAAIPRSIVLIMDYSGSLAPFITTSVEGAETLVDKLGPKDRMAIVTDDISLLSDFTRDKEELKKRLESLKEKAKEDDAKHGWYRGHSLQFSALMATLREMFDSEDVRPIIIFQTDGDELEILQPIPKDWRSQAKAIARPFSLKDVYAEVEKSRATIYSVIPGVRFFGLSEEEQMKQARVLWQKYILAKKPNDNAKEMEKRFNLGVESGMVKKLIELRLREQVAVAGVAELTGGQTEFLEEPSQASEIYSRILSGINRRYVIGYYPTNKQHDGKRRALRIEVRNHPEYTVWGRKFYTAPED